MHTLEPHFAWLNLYSASQDERSPFFERAYNEFYFDKTVYNYFIHPQWDNFGSNTLYIKILFADYQTGFAIIEMIGEWNDALYNDIMMLKREVLETLGKEGINKFILLGENVMNFHASDDSYYEEWFQDVEDGWIALLNFRQHVIDEFRRERIDYYINFGGELDDVSWRKQGPRDLFGMIDGILSRRLQ
ncbi:MAG: hypothetical protein O3B82_01775 [Bacteroidetes bacterium]|nr:hypothetical protein [Bacteroidota bacterium]